MSVEESDLPGVGKMYKVSLDENRRLEIVIHNTGKREVYLREDPEEDSEKLFELSDKLARTVGTILDGSYFQPVTTEDMKTKLDQDSVLEWVDVCDGSPAAGKRIADLDELKKVDVSIIAIRRNGKTLTNLSPDTKIEEGDELIVVESERGHDTLAELCEG